MKTDAHLDTARNLLMNVAGDMQTPAPERLDVILPSQQLLHAVETLQAARWGYLSTITGLDNDNTLEVLYHFCQEAAVVTLRISIPRDQAEVPSICSIVPSAILMERELHEMFGITVTDIPDDAHLFLPDDWETHVYPLRKDADLPAYPRREP